MKKVVYKLLNQKQAFEKILKLLNLKSEADLHEKRKEFFKGNSTDSLKLILIYDFLKKVCALEEWSPRWVPMIKQHYNFLLLEPQITIQEIKTDTIPSRQQSFASYVFEALNSARLNLNLKPVTVDTKRNYLDKTSIRFLFENLCDNFNLDVDHVCNKESTFFLTEAEVLPTQSTPIMLADPRKNILDILKVFRRETKDKTHLCEFHQLEYRKKYRGSDPLSQLITDIYTILFCFGLEVENLEVRKTRYTYTSPSIEVFYKKPDGHMVEVAGGGILIPKILERYGHKLNHSEYYLAAGIGLERLYTLVHELDSVSSCYPCVE